MSLYKRIDSGGKYINNIGGPVEDKLEFQKRYKFSIAFENSSTPGYTTEKILDAFAANTIPIYWGDPLVCREFNPKAFINCHDYNNLEDIIETIKEIDNNDELFQAILDEDILSDSEKKYEKDPVKEEEDWLVHILTQKPENAFRRNRIYWGKRIEDDRKRAAGLNVCPDYSINNIIEELGNSNEIIIYGLGAVGKRLTENLLWNGFTKISAICDRFCEDKAYMGIPVYGLAECTAKYKSALYVITVQKQFVSIVAELLGGDIPSENIVCYDSVRKMLTH